MTYLWNFGTSGIAQSTLEDPGSKVFNTAGTFTVTFTVTDSLGLADSTPATRVVTVQTADLVMKTARVSGVTGVPPPQRRRYLDERELWPDHYRSDRGRGSLSYADTQPAGVRVRNVTTTGFDVQAQEWDSQDGDARS